MKKDWPSRNWLIVNIIVVVGEISLACLIWFSGEWFLAGSRETFGPLNSYIFIWLSIVIATIAALNTVMASLIASKSLELSRATTRPSLTLQEADIIAPETLVRLVVKNTGTLPAENGKFKVNIIPIQEPDRPEIILEGEIPLLFPNDEMGLFLPTDKEIIQVPMTTSDFASLVNSGTEIHFRLEMKYRSFEKEYVYGKVLKLPPRQKGRKALANLVSVEGSSYYK